MSCSDKLARWASLGVQGALLSLLLAAPVPLTSLTVAAPPHLPPRPPLHIAALARALRAAARGAVPLPPPYGPRPLPPPRLLPAPPPPHELRLCPPHALTEGAHNGSPACGFAIAWSASGGGGTGAEAFGEVLQGTTGRKAGAPKGAARLSPATRSGLSRKAALASFVAAAPAELLARAAAGAGGQPPDSGGAAPPTYAAVKGLAVAYGEAHARLTRGADAPLVGWLQKAPHLQCLSL